MANKKITDLTELTAVASDDYLEIVDTSANTSKKISLENLTGGLGEWVTYTPTWTSNIGTPSLGNGTITGKYFRLGKMVIVNVALNFGSTTSASGTSTWYISLPFIAVNGMGVWAAYESGVKFHTGVLQVSPGSSVIVAFYASDGQGFFSETRPHTWGENDTLSFMVTYETA